MNAKCIARLWEMVAGRRGCQNTAQREKPHFSTPGPLSKGEGVSQATVGMEAQLRVICRAGSRRSPLFSVSMTHMFGKLENGVGKEEILLAFFLFLGPP